WMNSKAEAATENESTSSPLNLLGKFYFTNKEGIDLRISSSALDGQILNHFTKLPASGLLNIKTQIKGPYDRIDVNSDILAREFSLGGFYSNQLKGNFRLHLKDLSLEIPVLELGFVDQGSIELKQLQMDIAPPYKFSTSLKANKVPSNFLSQGLNETFNATSTAFELHHLQGNIAGNLLEPFAYRGKLNFSIQNLTFDHETLLSEASGKISGNEKNWSLENANIRLQKLEARIAMHIDHHSSKVLPKNFFHRLGILPNDHVHLSIKTLNQNLNSYRTNEISQEVNHLATLPYIGKFFREQKFGGQILLDADLEGPIDRLQGKIEGSLEQPYVWGIPISSFNISGFIDGWQLHIPELRHSGNALVGRLNIDFGKADMPYDWYFYMNQMDIRAIIGKIFAEDPRNFAYLSAEWTMAGRLTSFWSSQGEIAFNRIRSKIFRNLGSRTSSIELNSDDPIRIKITPQTWTMVEKKPLKLKGEYFDLSFTAGVNKLPDQLDIAVNGFVKLDILKNFSNIVETSRGEIVIDGSLRGSLSKPELSIHFRERRLDPFNLKEWQPLAIGLTDLGPSLNNIVMDVELRNEKIIVNKFKASKGREGSINIAGQLNFFDDDLDLSRLTIDLDRFEFNRLNVPVVKTADLTLTGKLLVTGNSLPLNLNGDITINRLQSIGNFDLRKQIVSSLYDSKINSNAGNGGGSDQAPYLNLDVAVKADKSVTVKNKSLEAVLSADLQVKGTDIKPLLKGQIVADRGTFNYRRNFKISQAVISFDEPVSPPNPRLDIIGETTVSPYKVTVIINGNLQTPKVQLTIDPPNRDDGSPISNLDILLLVSTGRIPEQANKTAEKASFNELVSFFAVFAEEPIEKLFDLSGQTVIREVYFDSYLSEAEQRPITRVNFPIRLGDKLNAVLQVDDEANTKVSLEYLIHEGITISGSLDKTSNKQSNVQNVLPADSGLDLKFRFGFD
ncbi:MAG: translocation/assembly module TamB domain-containing protein, partial [Proteobacteria bacterium]|nr:translocation/assembly module TamB domain-containing protein [Pseudomonadota bacterium]